MDKSLLTIPFLTSQYIKREASNSSSSGKFLQTVSGILDGSLSIGTRNPLNKAPWLTAEILYGGFASGNLCAGGTIQPHERDYCSSMLSLTSPETSVDKLSKEEIRHSANTYFLTTTGNQLLLQMLNDCSYYCPTTEEGALLSIALLMSLKQFQEAEKIVKAITPFFSQVRFFPKPSTLTPPDLTSPFVHVFTVSQVLSILQSLKVKDSVQKEVDSVNQLVPLTDLLVNIASVTQDEKGVPFSVKSREGECFYQDFIFLYENLSEKQKNSKRLRKSYRPFIQACAVFFNQKKKVSTKLKNIIKNRMDGIMHKRGLPGSTQHQQIREQQRFKVNKVENYMKDVSNAREYCSSIVEDNPTLGLFLDNISNFYSFHFKVQKTLRKAAYLSLKEVEDSEILSSCEQLAKVCHQMLIFSKISSYDEPSTQYLVYQLYSAFERRRSVLLFNLQSQVVIAEIPWFSALVKVLDSEIVSQRREEKEFEAAKDVVFLYFKLFPFNQLPNKFISALRQFKINGNSLKLVTELAVDIFENNFSPSFLQAVQANAKLLPKLPNQLYTFYFDIDPEALQELKKGYDLYELCASRIPNTDTLWFSTLRNGMIIEQTYVLSTMNLAQLCFVFNVDSAIIKSAVLKTAKFIIKSALSPKSKRVYKNTAYAFRQLLFYLSFLSNENFEQSTRNVVDLFQQNRRVCSSPLAIMISSLLDKQELPSVKFYGWVCCFGDLDWFFV
ncbi:hypothetical protein P9112_004760 [Eukaryota sp. TZLM1-RC]